jgi:hypothetical protein
MRILLVSPFLNLKSLLGQECTEMDVEVALEVANIAGRKHEGEAT